MDVANLLPAVEQLEYNIDDLEEALESLLDSSLEDTSKNLPLLDRAKLHVLLTYTLESLLFSYLKLDGVNVKDHAVQREIIRVKQYFAKIKDLETKPEKPKSSLDQQAARRFIAHGLSGNEKYDIERAEKLAKEKARAQLKAALLAKKQAATESSTPAVSHESKNTTTSSPNSDSSSDSESPDEVEEVQHEDPGNVFRDSTGYIGFTAEKETSEPTTAKMKARQRREEAESKKAEQRERRAGKAVKGEKQREIRKERRLKKNFKKKEKRAKEKKAKSEKSE
ncbi:hypothetical protein BGW36DRAFT_355226 [Talaromyces proteolyticus]|uniref:Exosome complex protein n=1 Tax=Talaromyces proteolyticus TaxID=1131652 RepID=A0AAD4KYD5_9EURO|nr:uncharacterized protein BGW36DRAFT_355226 [Talaromyces proteolyticus]KAH8703826.1 hypothetical protein BGW36DRAFT_355226 [Talaromyces proteolyticus]